MNPFRKLEAEVKSTAPAANFRYDLAGTPKGSSFAEVIVGDYVVSVEFRPGHGFGVTAPMTRDYGTGPDEVIARETAAIARVKELVRSKGNTTAVREISLKRLRELRRLTQQELAKRLEVKQATVSKLEQRGEVLVSTLAKVVAALGGSLEIVARFEEGPITLHVGDVARSGGRPKASSRRR